MYTYTWDEETGGILLKSDILTGISKEPRPVYSREMDLFGFNQYWEYDKSDDYPYMWAEGNNYFYRGKLVARTKGGTMCTAPNLVIIDNPLPLGQKLKPIDIALMVEKNKELLDGLTQYTIKRLYNTYVDYKNRVDLFYVAFSGGKDSIVALDIVQKALPHNSFKVLFGDTGMEFPDTYDTIALVAQQCKNHGIEFLIAKSHFDPEESWKLFGPPAQRIRWCCSVHKSTPQILLLRKVLNNNKFRGMAFTGVRGDESEARSEYSEVSNGDKVKGQYSCHPILDWNTAELFLYIYANNLILNPAYKKGNSRAGCLICPLAGQKNSYIKGVCYPEKIGKAKSTSDFNQIILETTSKNLSSPEAVEEFMQIGGWKARRSGRELSIARDIYSDDKEGGILTIKIKQINQDWKEWIKTLGKVSFSYGQVNVEFCNKIYCVHVREDNSETTFSVDLRANTKDDIYFGSYLKIVARKSAYCVACRVCEANCPNGYISFEGGNLHIDDNCVRCKKCYDIDYGCLAANSLKLPKGEKKMGSIDRYTNFGIEYDWVKEYFEKKDGFWDDNSLGSKKIDVLKNFLKDAEISERKAITEFGKTVTKMGADSVAAWGLMVSNLAYTPEFNWWIKNIEINQSVTAEHIMGMLDENLTHNTKDHVASAYKNIFISIKPLNTIGLGICDYEIKSGKRKLNFITRGSWLDPDPLVILYSLYKFAEHCGNYYQFTLSRLLNNSIESDGISPTEIFGLEREIMEKVLNGLAINYPEFISVAFTLDLDNINLKQDKTSADVLQLF